MKIGTRLFVSLAIPITLLIALFAVFEDTTNRMRSRNEVSREGRVIASTVRIAVENAMRDGQIEDARRLIDAISGHESILGVRLLDPEGKVEYSSTSLAGLALPPASGGLRTPVGGRVVAERLVSEGRPVIAWRAWLRGPAGTGLGAVEVLQLESFVVEDAHASSRAIAIFAVLLIAAAATTVLLVTRMSVSQPLEDLAAQARAIGEGDWATRLPERRKDELGRLARELNRMSERLEQSRRSLLQAQEDRRLAEANLRDSERLASLGRFAAGLAHEIGTPLNVISGRAESLQRLAKGDGDMERGLKIIFEQIERITRTVRGTLDFARRRDLRLAPTDLIEVLGGVVDLIEDRLEESGIRIESALPPDLPRLAADADRLQQVFLNLALNAADAMPSGGRLWISATRGRHLPPARDSGPQDCLVVSFEDSGSGIDPDLLPRLFEPFFTTKEVGSGTGLGLAISYGIVQEHGGWMTVASSPGRGTSVSVYLPLEAAGRDRERVREAAA